ncbi:MAG: cobyric acid synthase [Gemmatimonadota bacterium]
MTPAPALMVQGTASGVGKSWMVAALCRLFSRHGVHVCPFKAQNMSNNAAVTASGGEVGRAQAVQAVAAGVELDERMNPVLLKPLADTRSEVIVLGRSRPDLSRVPWMERKRLLWDVVRQSLDDLRRECDLVVIEGAGSPAEINLRAGDIVNMAVARAASAPVLLTADIDRGGAFASLLGTWELMDATDRRYVKGFVLNRFRGDAGLLRAAPEELLRRTEIPVVGVVPFVNARLPAEDAAELDWFPDADRASTEVRIAAVHLPHVANFDDLAPLSCAEAVRVEWTRRPQGMTGADAVIIPGTRNTLADLRWMWESGLAEAVRRAASRGVPVLGICGGLQMLGWSVSDTEGIEGGGAMPALGLLDVDTEFEAGKITMRTRARIVEHGDDIGGVQVDGYEIHHGRTTALGEETEVWMVDREDPDRVLGFRRGKVFGTYLHGIFSSDAFRRAWLRDLGVSSESGRGRGSLDEALDLAAEAVEEAIGLERLEAIVGAGAP